MSDCLFCRIVAGDIPSRQVYAGDDAVAFLDIAPFKRGHTLVVSRQHVSDALADADVLASLAPAITAVGRLLTERLGAQGMNILTNVGEVSGQSVFHLHVHLIPRFQDASGIEAMLTRDDDIDVDEVYRRLV
ncbi:HIT family protein [Propioniciclava tarda]|uniref:HIT domain-containing protein n=1 Tax=Propioniciclava tarda TaxID=433330 RepID=A0A4Q9KJF6_PROTD|nr:HIT domain-containing protein [Propioniciclava tarda]TBT94566.1 HIT domain-containing protein [Propioniciclava tarda]SMO68403.1 histidine triad (HIT) family protein [Propioniciclava tarda]HOA87878.1 HIT domain-containing protein [Propioniciclava tarda]HQA30020.1 HIT domain-containing protein [Propioniciclava tarda]HQD59656.1 HIT domain-containing protein [Propioniciclava tarda]